MMSSSVRNMGGGVQVIGPAEESDQLIVRPLGAGQEVGRSCIMLEFKGKKIMLDIGIHPGHTGMEALPFVDFIEADEVDLLLVSHFHLDHSGALPWFLLKTAFKGRCFMTHATKAIYRWLLSDYIKVSNISSDHILYTDQDLEQSMEKIEVLNFHEEKEVKGIKFWAYHAGHVLGAAMFMIEIAGVKVLYTGDFSRQEDRHLMAAEVPTVKPDVMIVESTYGTHIHEKREERESRFTGIIHETVSRGGRCLIPVFALGRAQELLLILDEYWGNHPELHDIPIYYASSLAKKCMAVYQTYVNAMNEKIRRQIAINNPFVFKHISNLKSIDHFEDVGPCVVMASPGMMQSGLSRELFEMWCTDPKNGVIIAGYCVEGTLAKQILSEPEDVVLLNGNKVPLKMSVDYISFSAHTDYEQTSEFIRILKPPNIVLVHGEANEMSRLKAALLREFEGEKMDIYNPKNTVAVTLHFRGEKMAKVMGSLASSVIGERGKSKKLSGILVKRNFNYHILAPSDLPKYTDLTLSTVTQRQSISYSGSFDLLRHSLVQLAKDVEDVLTNKKIPTIRIFGCIDISHDAEKKFVTIEWIASPVNDMYADAILTCVLQVDGCNNMAESNMAPPGTNEIDNSTRRKTTTGAGDEEDSNFEHFKECAIDTLADMFGRESIPKAFKKTDDNFIKCIVNGKEAEIDFNNLEVKCADDEGLEQIVQNVILRLHKTLVPIRQQTQN